MKTTLACRHSKLKGQIALEFFAVFIVALLFLVAVFAYSQQKQQSNALSLSQAILEKEARQLAFVIDSTAPRDGFHWDAIVPSAPFFMPRNTTVSNNTVWIDWQQNGQTYSVFAHFRAAYVKNQTAYAPFTLADGNYSVDNSGGTVTFTKR